MRLNPMGPILVAFIIGIETMFACSVLGISSLTQALFVALPAVLLLFPGLDACRTILVALFHGRANGPAGRQMGGMAMIIICLAVLPILPTVAICDLAPFISPSMPQAHSLFEAWRSALSLSLVHGLLVAFGLPGSISRLSEMLRSRR